MDRRSVVTVCALCLAVAAMVVLGGCAAKKPGAPAAGGAVTLEYKMPPGKPLVYSATQTSTQSMQVMNQYTNIDTRKSMTFTVLPKESKEGKQALTVTIDSLSASLTVPQGEFSADASSVLGKSFEMAVSSLGKETDITGADVIQYSLGAAGSRSVKPDFQTVFPDLAGKPLKVGDTWTTSDTSDVEEGGMKLKIASSSLNTLEGFEQVNGVNCARVSTASTGTITGEGEQQGMKVSLGGQTQSTDLWFFAQVPGMLVKFTSDVVMTGTIAVGGEQGMQIPMKQDMKTELDLVK